MLAEIKNKIRTNKKLTNLLWAIRGLYGMTPFLKNQKYFLEKTKGVIPEYLQNNSSRKLQIGAQGKFLQGWLNTDIWPNGAGMAYLDATTIFPMPDQSFKYIFLEHMIEHIPLDHADFMLKECHRILEKGGKIRISTPGLENYIANFNQTSPNPVFEKYFEKFVIPNFNRNLPLDASFAVNYIFYNFGHRFIFNKNSLKYILELNGFTNVQFFKPGQSDDQNLIDLEKHGKDLGEDMNEFESIVAEAEKN